MYPKITPYVSTIARKTKKILIFKFEKYTKISGQYKLIYIKASRNSKRKAYNVKYNGL